MTLVRWLTRLAGGGDRFWMHLRATLVANAVSRLPFCPLCRRPRAHHKGSCAVAAYERARDDVYGSTTTGNE